MNYYSIQHSFHFIRELVSSVRKELELKNTQLLWETAKLSETEAKLHKCEQEKAKYVNESTKTRMKLQEVKEKENDCKLNCSSVILVCLMV